MIGINSRMITSLYLLPPVEGTVNMAETLSLTSDVVRGIGWYGRTGLHTVAIRVLNFRGRIMVEGASVVEPDDDDWVSVLPAAAAYLEYPQRSYIVPPNNMGETSLTTFNFTANPIWLRASFDRSYLISPYTTTPLDIMPYGTISYVMLNY